MLKKFGMVTVGVTAGLLMAAPAASALEEVPDVPKHSKGDHKGDHKGSHKSGSKNIDCSAESGDVKGNKGKSLGLGIGSALDGNAGQILSCNSFLNDNLNNNEVDVL